MRGYNFAAHQHWPLRYPLELGGGRNDPSIPQSFIDDRGGQRDAQVMPAATSYPGSKPAQAAPLNVRGIEGVRPPVHDNSFLSTSTHWQPQWL